MDEKSTPSNIESVTAQQPRRKGPKPSSKRRIESFRLKKSIETRDRAHAERASGLELSDDELASILSTLRISQSTHAAATPITTRGIGLLSAKCYSRAIRQQPRLVTTANVHQVYRVSLAQHSMQLQRAEELGKMKDPTFRLGRFGQDTYLPDDARSLIVGYPNNFKLLADAINTTGDFSFQNLDFSCFVPKCIEAEIPDPLGSSPMDAGDQSTPKRRCTSARIFLPDPYTITFGNLRRTVEAMSRPATPVAVRSYFVENNPVPGARFDENHLLINPDEIMPPDYGRAALMDDCDALQAFFGIMKTKMATLLGKCTYDGKGSPSLLASVYKEKYKVVASDFGDEVESASDARVRTHLTVEVMDMLRGAIYLLGETPVDGLPGRDPRAYSMREPIIQHCSIESDWSGLVGRCLT